MSYAYSFSYLIIYSTITLGAALFWGAYATDIVFSEELSIISNNRITRISVIIIILGFLSFIYSYLGGLSAVVRTDIIQFSILTIGGLAILFVTIKNIGGWENLYTLTPEKMQKNRFNLGGEQSGHIILGKFATTGDGLLVALEALFAIRKGRKASSFFNKFNKTPQILENIAVKDKSIIKNLEIKKSIKTAEKLMKGHGRILVRESGTESKIRVMGESENKQLLDKCINIILRKIN